MIVSHYLNFLVLILYMSLLMTIVTRDYSFPILLVLLQVYFRSFLFNLNLFINLLLNLLTMQASLSSRVYLEFDDGACSRLFLLLFANMC